MKRRIKRTTGRKTEGILAAAWGEKMKIGREEKEEEEEEPG